MHEFAGVFAFSRGRWARYAEELHEDLRVVSIMVLQTVMRREKITATELGAALDMDKAMVSRQVSKLRSLGLVCAFPDENDGRVTWLSLTESGKQSLHALHAKLGDAYRERLGGWSESDLVSLKELLLRFNGSESED